MKTNKLIWALFFIVICSTDLKAQSEVDLKKFDDAKFTLIQRMLTCQSVAFTAMNTSDYTARKQYVEFGNKNYNYAYEAFIEMQIANVNIDDSLRKQISNVLELYSKAYSSIHSLDNQEIGLALSFAQVRLELIIQDLYGKKE